MVSILKKLSKIAAFCTLFFSYDSFQCQTFTPELKQEIRAPDKWEILYKIAVEDKSLQSKIMDTYRANEYALLFEVNERFEKCEDIWRLKAEALELPPSAAFIPLMLYGRFEDTKCDCNKSGDNLQSLRSIQNLEFISVLKGLFDASEVDDEFDFFLQELSIVIRLIENFNLQKITVRLNHHLVKKGETLYRLSAIYGVSVSEIQTANKLGATTNITIGSLLTIPE